jgi:DNA processing protein
MSDLETQKKYYNAFNQIPQIGATRFHKLRRHFNTIEQAWRANSKELAESGLEPHIVDIVLEKRKAITPEQEWEKLLTHKVSVVTFEEKNYPKLLKEIHNPPALLYIRGDAELLTHEYSLAMVGTRKVSSYGKQVTPQLARDLASNGIVVVSGLALGVDGLAHHGALESKGKTIAVLGSGIDSASVYPSANRLLAERIVNEQGALISELPLGSMPLKMHFPYRNRIIAGMTLGTIVVEADLESGSLITAQAALEYNRQVFAVPGSIYNRVSAGPNNLLKLGARPVTNVKDILEELNIQSAAKEILARKVLPSSPQEELILKYLNHEPTHINKLIKETGLSAGEVTATLTMMEIKGLVKNLGAMQYSVSR